MPNKQNKPVDPAIIVTLGIVFIAIAIGLFAFQSNPTSIGIAKSLVITS